VLLTLCLASGALAQGRATVDAGTAITVRTNDHIDGENNDGRVFRATVTQNVLDRNGDVVIPRGSEAELIVRDVSGRQAAVELSAVNVNGDRIDLTSGAGVVNGGRREAMTRGRTVYVPNNTLLTFRLEQPARVGYADRDMRRSKPGYNDEPDSPAYRAGLAAGRSDADRNLPRNTRSSRWSSNQDRRDFEDGYNRAYDNRTNNNSNVNPAPGASATIRVGRDNNVTWQAVEGARVFVQVDNNPMQLFAQAASGTQLANWIQPGHVYVFVVRDANGNQLAQDRLDLRRR